MLRMNWKPHGRNVWKWSLEHLKGELSITVTHHQSGGLDDHRSDSAGGSIRVLTDKRTENERLFKDVSELDFLHENWENGESAASASFSSLVLYERPTGKKIHIMTNVTR